MEITYSRSANNDTLFIILSFLYTVILYICKVQSSYIGINVYTIYLLYILCNIHITDKLFIELYYRVYEAKCKLKLHRI